MALDFFAGCLGGCAGIVVGYPLDTIKVHIQTQDHRNPKYKGTWHCFRTLLARDSIAGLYKGMSSPMAGVALVNAIVFGVYGQSQKYLQQNESFAGGGNPGELHLSGHFIAGVLAGVAQAPICSPMELAKTRLQLQERKPGVKFGGSKELSGPVQCLIDIYRSKGLRGLFNGLGITVMREAPSFGVYFVTYELLAGASASDSQPVSTWRMLLAGGLAGSASWLVSYPLDVIKSRLQADTTDRYSGALDCFRKSVKSEGYGCLYRGLNPTIIRAFPTNAATFVVVAWTLRLLSAEQPEVQDTGGYASQLSSSATASQSSPLSVDTVKTAPASSRQQARQSRPSYVGDADEEQHRIFEKPSNVILRQLQTSAALVLTQQHAAGLAAVQLARNNSRRQHFDEMHHFESVREILDF